MLKIHNENVYPPQGMSSKLLRLRRFLYTGNESALYRTGDPHELRLYYRSKLPVINEIIKCNNLDMVLAEVKIANDSGCLPRPETVLFVLVVAHRYMRNCEHQRQILSTLKCICKSLRDLYKFINFHIKCGGRFGVDLKGFIREYFLEKEPLALAIEITSEDGCEGWEHKNMIEMVQIEAKEISTKVILEYVTKGLNSAIECANRDKESQEILNRFRQVEELKNCDNGNRAAELVKILKCDLSMAPTGFHRNWQVWAAVASVISIRKLLLRLPELLNLNVLQPGCLLEELISRYLTVEEFVKRSDIEPLEVLTIITHFDKSLIEIEDDGHTEMFDKNDDNENENEDLPNFVCITNALYTMLDIVVQNRHSINKRFMVTVEMTNKMEYFCLTEEHMSCLTAVSIFIIALTRLEPHVTIGIFDGYSIRYVAIPQRATPSGVFNTLVKFESSFVLPTAVFDSAIQQGAQIDMFINFMSDFEWITTIPEELTKPGVMEASDGLEHYRKVMLLPDSKLVNFSLSSPEWRIGKNSPGILDVYGFSTDVAKVIRSFANDFFN